MTILSDHVRSSQFVPSDAIRITGLRTVVVNAAMRNWIFVKVETNIDGLYGWGEATLEWKTRSVVGAVADLEPLVIGLDPRDTERLVRVLQKHSFWRLGVIGSSAISGIEMACWDIFGKSVGLPVWRLLGGQTRNRVQVYTHLGMGDMTSVYESLDTGSVIERALAVIERGYRALKVVFIPYTHYTASRKSLRHVETLMSNLRDTVGDDIEIMVDFHGRCASASSALQYLEVLEPFHPLFVEELLPPGEALALAEITRKTSVPIATGERLVDRKEFDELFRLRAIHIAQPDLCHVGGFTEARKIAAAAETAHCGIAPHNPLGPLAGVAALHFAVATPNFVIQEEMSRAVPWYDEVLTGPIRFTDGFWAVPQAPGLGVEIDELACARHPFEQETLHTSTAVLSGPDGDGTVVDW